MKTQDLAKTRIGKHRSGSGIKGVTILVAVGLLTTSALAQPTHQHPATNAPMDTAALQAQLGQLRNQVAELSRIMQSHGSAVTQASGAGGAGMPGMAGGTSSGGMGMMDMDMMKMKGLGNLGGGSGAMSGMGMMNMMGDGMGGMSGMAGGSGSMSGMSMGDMGNMGMMNKGMEMMGMMKGMSGMSMSSALPGFPGASHLYHIGATGFFLDHGDHVKLTTEQQSKLNQIKEKTSLEQATADRSIEETEQQLWELTASDQPDAKAIEAKIREIEKLRGDQRFAFIRAVGDAAKVLTHEQHQILTGAHPKPVASPHSTHQP